MQFYVAHYKNFFLLKKEENVLWNLLKISPHFMQFYIAYCEFLKIAFRGSNYYAKVDYVKHIYDII